MASNSDLNSFRNLVQKRTAPPPQPLPHILPEICFPFVGGRPTPATARHRRASCVTHKSIYIYMHYSNGQKTLLGPDSQLPIYFLCQNRQWALLPNLSHGNFYVFHFTYENYMLMKMLPTLPPVPMWRCCSPSPVFFLRYSAAAATAFAFASRASIT